MQQVLKKVLNKIASPITNKIIRFKGRHKGESCYIFGDGVSIKWFELDAFPKKTTFTLSCLPFHKEVNALDVRYSLLIQPYYFYPYFRSPYEPHNWHRHKIKDMYIDFFKKNKKLDCFVSLSNYPILRGSNIFHLFKAINDPDFDYFQECNANGVGIYNGSLCASISLAIYMGFEEITLVGCDYTHENSTTTHWYEKGKGILAPHINYERKFLEIACKYAKIITITLDGVGNIIPSLTYREFTGRSPFFRENNEIIDIETLKLLDMLPGYKIF